MAKGGYLGGSTVIGLHGSFIGTPQPKLTKPTEIDPHLTQKQARNEARAKVEGPRKKQVRAPKSELRAEKAARKQCRDAPTDVMVEHKINGVIVSTRTIQRK